MEQMTGHNKSEFFWFTQKREVLLPPLGVNVNCEAFFVKGSLTYIIRTVSAHGHRRKGRAQHSKSSLLTVQAKTKIRT